MANDIRVTLGMDTRQADDALKKYRANVKKAGVALSAIGAAGTLAIKGFTKAAIDQKNSLELVLTTARNAGDSMAGLEEKVLNATAALQKKSNFGDEEQMKVLAQLIPMLGSTENALAALPAVMDVATLQGQDLTSAVRTMGPALAGVTNRIRGTTLEFDASQGPMERVGMILSQVGGTAEAAMDPFTQLSMASGDLKEKIGDALLPTVTVLLEKLVGLTEFLQTLNPTILKFGAGILGGATALGVILGPTLLFGAALKGILATSIAFIATPLGAVIMAIAAAVAAVILVWKNWDSIVLFFKETLNKLIGIINDKFIGAVNNMIEAMNKVPFVDVGYVDKIKTFETKIKDVGETIKKTSETVVQDAIPSFEGLKDLVDMSAQQMAALEKGIESLKKPVTEEDKAQDRLAKITERLGLKTGALNSQVKELVNTGFFTLEEALTEISRKYEGQFADAQARAKDGLTIFNKELERQRLEAELGADALQALIVQMERAAAVSGGRGSVAPALDPSQTPHLSAEKFAEQTGLSLAEARSRLEGFPQATTGITNNVSITVNANTNASADEIAGAASNELKKTLGTDALANEHTRSS